MTENQPFLDNKYIAILIQKKVLKFSWLEFYFLTTFNINDP